jgi:hypothetical protein
LEEIVAGSVKKTETNYRGIRCADHATPSIRKSLHYFANKRRSLGRHSSLADQSRGVFINITFLLLLLLQPPDGARASTAISQMRPIYSI